MTSNEYMVTQKEAADFLHVSTKSISRYRKKGLPYKLILNPVLGKQEVRFRYADLERWDEGRQMLATYPRDSEDSAASTSRSGGSDQRPADPSLSQGFLAELLVAYKEQIELLRDQMEDMREQLSRRDRQIDDLMRLMVGLQLEYKPMASTPTAAGTSGMRERQEKSDILPPRESLQLFETIPLPDHFLQAQTVTMPAPSPPAPDPRKKSFSREQLSASILRLRRKGRSYAEIAGGLNRIEVATLSGQPQWTVHEVRTLLPALIDGKDERLSDEGAC